MEMKLLNTDELSEANIRAIVDFQCQQILKGKVCPVCNCEFFDIDDAILTDKEGDNLIFSHEDCLTNKWN